jgi:hypothetical protein
MSNEASSLTSILAKEKGSGALKFTPAESRILLCHLRNTGQETTFFTYLFSIGGTADDDRKKWVVDYWRDYLRNEFEWYRGFADDAAKRIPPIPRDSDFNKKINEARMANAKQCLDDFGSQRTTCVYLKNQDAAAFPKPVKTPVAKPVAQGGGDQKKPPVVRQPVAPPPPAKDPNELSDKMKHALED